MGDRSKDCAAEALNEYFQTEHYSKKVEWVDKLLKELEEENNND